MRLVGRRLGWEGARAPEDLGPGSDWPGGGSSPHFTGEQTEARRGEGKPAPGLAGWSQGPGEACVAGSLLEVTSPWLSILPKLCDLARGWQSCDRPPLHLLGPGPERPPARR